jgi:hypothetical protein
MSVHVNVKPRRHVGSGGVNSQVLTAIVEGRESLAPRPGRFTRGILKTGYRFSLRAGLDNREKIFIATDRYGASIP